MRYLILLLALMIASPAWGGKAAKRMLSMTSEIGYNVSTFEGGSSDSWTAYTTGSGSTVLDGLARHSGTYSYSMGAGTAGTGYVSITRTFTCEAGDITFWSLRNNNFSSGRVLIDGAPVWAYDGTNSTIWTQYTIAVTAGSHAIKFEIPNTSSATTWNIDDISVPVP